MIDVYLDNNLWDYFYKNSINIIDFFPTDKFTLLISKHGKFEIDQIPLDNPEKKKLLKFIFKHLEDGIVSEKHTFGFCNPEYPDDEQRVSGFDTGVFTSEKENHSRHQLKNNYSSQLESKRKNTQILYKQEADIELAALSTNSIVLSLDKKKGPLRDALKSGRKVIFLNDLECKDNESVIEKALELIEQQI